jgi:hypothetical protein
MDGEGVFAHRRVAPGLHRRSGHLLRRHRPSEGGRINLSPKGYRDTFAVLDDRTVAYLDLFGNGRVVRPDDAEFTGLLARFGGQHAGIRAVLRARR